MFCGTWHKDIGSRCWGWASMGSVISHECSIGFGSGDFGVQYEELDSCGVVGEHSFAAEVPLYIAVLPLAVLYLDSNNVKAGIDLQQNLHEFQNP